MMSRLALLSANLAVAHMAVNQRARGEKVDDNQGITALSAKKQVLGQRVHNDKGEFIGKIEDLLLAKKIVSHAIVGVGGFLGMGARNVAIPVERFTRSSEKIVLPGATRQAVLAMPRFEYGE